MGYKVSVLKLVGVLPFFFLSLFYATPSKHAYFVCYKCESDWRTWACR
jgi:hypothetical protein